MTKQLPDAGVAAATSPPSPDATSTPSPDATSTPLPDTSASPQGEKGGGYQDWTVADVLQWLTDSKITSPSVHEAFKQHHVDGEVLFYLTEKELIDIVPSTGLRKKFLIARHKLAESTTHDASPRHGMIHGLMWHHHGSSKHLLTFGSSDRQPHGAHHAYGMGFATDALGRVGAWSPRSPRSNPPPIWSQHGHGHGHGHGRSQGLGLGRDSGHPPAQSRGDVESAEPSTTKEPSEDDIVDRLSKALMAVSLGLRQLHHQPHGKAPVGHRIVHNHHPAIHV